MKYLLTSGGVTNTSIHDTLVDLLGKPISESSALCIPTAIYARRGGTARAWDFIRGVNTTPLCDLGWKSSGILELTALPSIEKDYWVSQVQEADALLFGGGDAMYLYYWMRESGLADLLPELPREKVYVGASAGSMVLTPRIGEDFVNWKLPTGGDTTLGLVDFSIFPHLDHEQLLDNTMANAEKWAAEIQVPAYAIDDQTAIEVIDGAVKVVSEGHWKRFDH